jgi:uncharacterized membrane protein
MTEKKDIATTLISGILFVGSICAAALLALGLGMMWLNPGRQDQLTNLVRSPLSDLFSALLRGEPLAVINLGILLMMLTPLLRVVAAIISFLMEKDRRYAAVGIGVALILLATIAPNLF